ncbi:MAG: hypothetical protein P8Y92_09810, partial [Halioglobus sp.]
MAARRLIARAGDIRLPVAQRLPQRQQPHHAPTPKHADPLGLDTTVLAFVSRFAPGSAEQFVGQPEQQVFGQPEQQFF